MGGVIRNFLGDDSAQDVVEYAFLALFVGLVGIVLWPVIVTLIGARYTNYNTGVQNVWESPEPDLGP